MVWGRLFWIAQVARGLGPEMLHPLEREPIHRVGRVEARLRARG